MTSQSPREPRLPSPERIAQSELTRYQQWLRETQGVEAQTYEQLHAWSVDHLEEFWDSIWEFFDIIGERGTGPVRVGDSIPETQWFPGARVNYAENVLR